MDRWFGESASFLLGVVYIALVLFIPYGLVGTWRARVIDRRHGWQRLLELFGLGRDKEENTSIPPDTTSE